MSQLYLFHHLDPECVLHLKIVHKKQTQNLTLPVASVAKMVSTIYAQRQEALTNEKDHILGDPQAQSFLQCVPQVVLSLPPPVSLGVVALQSDCVHKWKNTRKHQPEIKLRQEPKYVVQLTLSQGDPDEPNIFECCKF